MLEQLRILLVEDNRGDANLIEEMIKDTGVPYGLTWINDGQGAIDFFENGHDADIILLDLKIPKVSGHEVLSFLNERGIPSRIPVVILTGSTFKRDIELTKMNGAASYLLKPMSIEEMEEVTRKLKGMFQNIQR